MLLKNPGFTLVAILSLSVGIGVNSTVFGFINAIFFKPISVSNNDGLVYVFAGNRRNPYRNTSYLRYTEFQQQNDAFSGLAAYAAPPVLMTKGDHPEEISSEVVSGNYFSVLDVRLQRGQGFTTAHDQLATEPSVVISDSFWKRRLGSDQDIVGKQLILNGHSFSVIGIAMPSFTGTDPTVSTDVWIPITQWAALVQLNSATAEGNEPAQGTTANAPQEPTNNSKPSTNRLNSEENWLSMVGRLKPGVAVEQAESVMNIIATRLPLVEDEEEQLRVSLSPVGSVHPEVRAAIPEALFILALTSLILIICSVNVASLMLSRAVARQKEFAIRLALGSSRKRFVRQLLTEAVLLSLIGGIIGLLFAYWTTRIVLRLIPAVDLSPSVAIDPRVLGFSLTISFLTALMFGLLPALNSFRPNLVQSLGAEGMSFGDRRRKITLRRVLVVVQIVASSVLLITTGLFLRSFQQGQEISKNFMSDKILLLDLSARKYGYAMQYNKTFFRQLVGRVGAMPGVESVTLSNVVPLTTHGYYVRVTIEGPESRSLRLRHSRVAEGYFKTLNIPIVRGREFDTTDDNASRRAVIINETMANTYWPNENPLGKQIQVGAPAEIVGVAKDSSYNNFGKASEPYLYLWVYQLRELPSVSLIVRTSGEPKTMIPMIQRDMKELGGNLPGFDFQTLEDLTQSQLAFVKATALLLTLLSLIGLIVASIGIYGVTSYAFSQRGREIGIRMALGAQRRDILKLIMKEGISLAVLGTALGVALALGTTQFVSSLLYGVSPVDPVVFVGVAILLGLVTLGASLVPAIMATKADPVKALRYQ